MPDQSHPRALEADVLLWIARLPLLRLDDLSQLTGVPPGEVQRAVDTLRRHGWTDSVQRGCSPDEPELHVLRDVTASRFAEAFQLDEAEMRMHWPVERRDILDHLSTIDISVGVNGFLARLAEAWADEGAQVVDLRALPRSRRGGDRWWPSWMEAYGCVDSDSYHHFFVAWDVAGVPAMHRRARVRSWYDAAAANNWWGAGCLPTILLICSGVAEEREWARVVEATARRRDTPELRIATTSPVYAAGDDPFGHWRWLDDDRDLSIDQVLTNDEEGAPFAAPDARFDLVDRGVDIRTPSLHEWATTVLASGHPQQRDETAALSIMLAAAHWRVLRLIVRHPYLTDRQIADVLDEQIDDVRRVMTDLQRHELIASVAHAGVRA